MVAFSLAPDAARLVKAKLVAATWDSDQHKGMITNSVVVLVTRKWAWKSPPRRPPRRRRGPSAATAVRIFVMAGGVVEQEGTPEELYERPASDFVMSFPGPVTKLNGALVRLHDLDLYITAEPGSVAAQFIGSPGWASRCTSRFR